MAWLSRITVDGITSWPLDNAGHTSMWIRPMFQILELHENDCLSCAGDSVGADGFRWLPHFPALRFTKDGVEEMEFTRLAG